MRHDGRKRTLGASLIALGLALQGGAQNARAETEYGGIDFSGFSAWGSSSGAGASTGIGIPFGPSQTPRREATAPTPRPLPTPPSGAIPAAAPPADPVLQAPLVGGRSLVPPSTFAAPAPAAVVAQAPAASVLPPPPPAASAPLTLPGAPTAPSAPGYGAPAPGYGSPSLGYGPTASYAPPPVYQPAPAPPAPVEPPVALPPSPSEGFAPWRDMADDSGKRFYLSGILGTDFSTLELTGGPNANGPLFTSGGAVGIAFERPNGWFRGEFEARYRDPVVDGFADPYLGNVQVTASDGWSTMINGWRDFEITDRFGAYLGGGIGGGGYRVSFTSDSSPFDATLSGSTRLTGLAWQAGTGVTWLVHDRIALDLGYRYFSIDGGPAEAVLAIPPVSVSEGVGTRYGASEFLVTVRVFEPFRRWGD